MLAAVKLALRITNTAFDSEIESLIDAARLDLQLSGVRSDKVNDDSDKLIERAITVYCKAHFGLDNPDYERYASSYDSLKRHLTLAGDYIETVE
ncbi:MAG: DNA-packaging protein [Exiguobacterium sp.]|uniref:head-tail connector protein n=1 Tax=Exiguobacterium TaxID=33986 RepID=UPI00257D0AA3|nr:head-tail connector protein [Exiguobacterium sp.]MBQ6459118.1 DNA-packaging protein [Exiguobacterium sp.]